MSSLDRIRESVVSLEYFENYNLGVSPISNGVINIEHMQLSQTAHAVLAEPPIGE